MVKVSVIIPCYNKERYIGKTLESLKAQHYANKEFIFIDDGSTDATPHILDEFAKTCPEAIVVHKVNGGVASARNTGLDLAVGDYIMFADPDDTVQPDFISTAVKAIEESGAELMMFGFNTDWTGKYESFSPLEHYDFTCNEDILNVLLPRIFGLGLKEFEEWLQGERLNPKKETGQIWRWIYKREFIERNKIRFPNIKVSEDMVFNVECLLKAERLKSIDTCLYNYYPRRDGLMYSNINGLGMLRNKQEIIMERERLGKIYEAKTGRNALDLYAGSCIMSCFELGFILSRDSSFKEYRSYLKNPIVKESIRRSKIHIQNKKALLPHVLLKAGAHRLLFYLFKLANKLNLNASY